MQIRLAERLTHESGIVSIGFDDRPYVPVEINGEGPFYLLLDTGATGPDITQRVAEALRLPISPVHPTFRRIDRLKIGAMEWRDYHLSVGHDRPPIRRLGHTHDGFIGSTMILDLAVTIDYGRAQLSLQADGISKAVTKTGHSGPLHVELRQRETYPYRYSVVDVLINDSGPYRFLLDTGAGRCNVSPELVADLDLAVSQVNGHDAVTLHSLSLYGWCASDVSAYVLDCSHVQVEGPLHGYLGHNFLSMLKVSLDYPQHRIHLE